MRLIRFFTSDSPSKIVFCRNNFCLNPNQFGSESCFSYFHGISTTRETSPPRSSPFQRGPAQSIDVTEMSPNRHSLILCSAYEENLTSPPPLLIFFSCSR